MPEKRGTRGGRGTNQYTVKPRSADVADAEQMADRLAGMKFAFGRPTLASTGNIVVDDDLAAATRELSDPSARDGSLSYLRSRFPEAYASALASDTEEAAELRMDATGRTSLDLDEMEHLIMTTRSARRGAPTADEEMFRDQCRMAAFAAAAGHGHTDRLRGDLYEVEQVRARMNRNRLDIIGI